MTEKDKQDCLQGVQEYIKQNTNSQDKEALMQAIEKVLQQNYIFDSDVLEVLDYIGVNIWGIYHKGYMDFKGNWHDDYYELELGIWERGSLCCGMIKDAIRLLKKKYTYMQSRNVGGSSSACGASPECVCPADSDVSSVCVVSPENGKVQSKQPQQLEQPQDDGVCPADSDVLSVGGVSPENGKVQSKQPQQLEQPQKKRGRSAKSFSDCILVEDKDGLLAKLHQVLDGRKGRDVYLVLNTLLYEGVLLKYTYTQAKNEFGDIGSDSLKTKYSGSKDDKVSCVSAFDKGEIEGVKKIFSEFLK